MIVRLIDAPADLSRYDAWCAARPEATLWQSLDWKKYQESLGRETRLYVAEERDGIAASALVIIDRTSFGLSTWDIPRGPLWESESHLSSLEELLHHMTDAAKKDRCMSIYLSPGHEMPKTKFGSRHSSRHEQPEATRVIDLTSGDEDILKQMHQKGRYNIGLAQKHGVRVEESRDVATFHRLLTDTAGRDHFTAGPKKRYELFLKELPGSFLLLARAADGATPIAGLLGVLHGTTGYYYYGASSYADRALMGPYLLQWEAMRYCKARGAHSYDLLGVSPPDAGPDHPWQGVSGFKAKFGGRAVSYPPEQEITLKPALKGLLEIKRRIVG